MYYACGSDEKPSTRNINSVCPKMLLNLQSLSSSWKISGKLNTSFYNEMSMEYNVMLEDFNQVLELFRKIFFFNAFLLEQSFVAQLLSSQVRFYNDQSLRKHSPIDKAPFLPLLFWFLKCTSFSCLKENKWIC